MDQVKIGRFIAERRKTQQLTQRQLAERLGVTDRAVSKWETGRAMPDASLMLDLCHELGISVNDLLCGEVVTVDHYNKEMENNLLQLIREKEKADRRLLTLELVVVGILLALLLALAGVARFAEMKEWLRILLVVLGVIPILVALPFMIRIEQTAGYYECGKCHHRHVPSFSAVFFAMHLGFTRYMTCPRCHRRSWQKKVLTQEKETEE